MTSANAVLVVVALAFAWSMGAHYTGACMGMPYATRSIRLRPALMLMAALTLLGAAFLSHRVLTNIGHNILIVGRIDTIPAIIIIGVAFLLTVVFTSLRVPTSTVQILVFCVIGAGLALKLAIDWTTIVRLVILWVLAPVFACALGFGLTRLLDFAPGFTSSGAAGPIGKALVFVGGTASLTMGANDVSNATAVFLTTHFSGPFLAGVVGGIGLAVGVLTWGRPLLNRVAFDIVRVDMGMAIAAQLVQAAVVLAAVFLGYFTSMNQALIGAMAGAGLARGRETIQTRVILGILRGWIIGPTAGMILAFLITRAVLAL